MKIVAAAIKVDNMIYTGVRHAYIMCEIRERGHMDYITQDQQGFVTDTGIFVSREDAAVIAFETGQIDRQKLSVCSEDLW